MLAGMGACGGFSIASQKALNRDHRVDWGQVGVDAFVGLVGGAAGGGAALGLARGATALGVSSGALTSRLGSGLSGSAMRNALSGGVEGSVSNTLDYALDGDAEHDVGGFAANAGIGFATGGVGSAGGGRLGDVWGNRFSGLGVREKFVPVGRHVHMPQHDDAPKSWGRYGGELAGDGLIGGIAGYANEYYRPITHGDGGRDGDSLWTGLQGLSSGSPGYDAGLHRAPGW